MGFYKQKVTTPQRVVTFIDNLVLRTFLTGAYFSLMVNSRVILCPTSRLIPGSQVDASCLFMFAVMYTPLSTTNRLENDHIQAGILVFFIQDSSTLMSNFIS